MKYLWISVVAAVVLGWIPVLARFFRSWRDRSNPISLAICVLIAEALYLPIYLALERVSSWILATVCAVNMIVCGTFHAAFWWADKRFQSTRNGSQRAS